MKSLSKGSDPVRRNASAKPPFHDERSIAAPRESKQEVPPSMPSSLHPSRYVDGTAELALEALDIGRLGVRDRIGAAVDHPSVQYLHLIVVHDLADVAVVLEHQLSPVRR